MKFEHIDDDSHTMASNEAAVVPPMAAISVPPPGRVDGFSPFGRGHSPGIGHSIQN